MEKKTKILFMGTPPISAYVLEALIVEGYNIIGVVSQADKPIGRKGELVKTPTKLVAEKYNIPVFQPLKIRKDYDFVRELNPELILTLAYGQIIPQGMLDIPRFGSINLHGSLLPKLRGASPIQYALINGLKVTGMTLMEMTNKMDEGKMFAKKKVVIEEYDNSTSLFEKMSVASKELILEALPLYLNNKLEGIEQNEEEVSYCYPIKAEQEKLDLSNDYLTIHGWIRALSDAPGAYLLLDNEKIKIYKSMVYSTITEGEVGQIIKADKNGLVVQFLGGQLKLIELQKSGKKRMNYKDFINGNKNLLGKVFF